jgi:hypothetical protein
MDEFLNSKLSCRLAMILSNLKFNSYHSRGKRFKKSYFDNEIGHQIRWNADIIFQIL